MSIKDIKYVLKNCPTNETLGVSGITGKFCHILKEEIIKILHKLKRIEEKITEEKTLFKSFKQVFAALTPGTEK